MVSLVINARELRKLERILSVIPNGVKKVMVPTINRTLDHGRTVVKREIRKDYLIKAKDIPVKTRKVISTNKTGQVIVKQGMLDLNKFKVVPKNPQLFQRHARKRLVFAQVRKSGGGTMPGAFVAVMPASGYKGPFIRAAGAGRLPVHKLVTIGAPIMASQPHVGPAVNKAMGDMFAKRLDHEIRRVMASAGGHS